MLVMPADASPVVSIIGIDPGSDTLGVAVLSFNIETRAIVSTQAVTLKGSKEGKGSWTTEIHGDRLGRIESHRRNLLEIFRQVQPLQIAAEMPFFNHLHPSAFGPLMETICAIRHAVMQYDVWKYLYTIDPPTVKKAAGLVGLEIRKGGKEGKELMSKAVCKLAAILNYSGAIPIELLDEHSIDAIAVAYCRYLALWEE